VLNKKTVSNLDTLELRNVNGGGIMIRPDIAHTYQKNCTEEATCISGACTCDFAGE
ncbi:MAG: hypothetical protein GY765_15200, partial [bacterium]|nr:hypothetical protein [bacterium]